MKRAWDESLWLIVFAGLVILGAVTPAASDLVPPDPWEVIHVARAQGEAEVGRDTMRDPEINGVADGQSYSIGFYGCDLGRNCTSLLFQARFVVNEDAADQLASWNTNKLFGRAWLDDAGQAVLDHPVAMTGGMPKETLAATFMAWQTAVAEFKKFLDISED